MFKDWLKRFLAICICAMTILSSFSMAFADDDEYVAEDGDDDATYYIIEGKDVDKLFDFNIYDVPDITAWIWQFRTFTVIKKYEDSDGDDMYKMYFNTPNLQSLAKNYVTSSIGDGYTDTTYDINDTEWIINVGSDADDENVITKYGFNIPCYTYMGEYPQEVMSVAGILPVKEHWWQVAWRAIKSLFGVSFIKAPDVDNFNSIRYLNHTYRDSSDYILNFFKLYYLDYFERKIPTGDIDADDDEKAGDYFDDAEEVIELAVAEDVYKAADRYNTAHSDEYADARTRYRYFNLYLGTNMYTSPDEYDDDLLASPARDLDTMFSYFDDTGESIGNRKLDVWHFLASSDSYRNTFNTWAADNSTTARIFARSILSSRPSTGISSWSTSNISTMGGYGFKSDGTYEPNKEKGSDISAAADILRYLDQPGTKLHVVYSYTNVTSTTTWVTGGASVTSTSYDPVTDVDVTFDLSNEWRDDPNGRYHEQSSSGTNNGDRYTTTSYDTGFTIQYLYCDALGSAFGSSNQVSYDDYKTFINTCAFENIDYDLLMFVPSELQSIYDIYEDNDKTIERYTKFCEMLARGDDQDDDENKKEILYRQCMIRADEEAEDGECWSKEFGDEKTSLTVVNVYAFSRIYQVTEDYDDDEHELTDEDAHAILFKLQNYCGPYYNEVVGNMMALMCATANYDDDWEPMFYVLDDDPRVMPYDTATLLPRDRSNYAVSDPRVTLYKTHTIGKLISSVRFELALGIYIKPQTSIINLAGRITEFSVFFQKICDFELLDSYGLSPANLWVSGYVTLLMGLLVIFFLAKTVVSIVKMGTSEGPRLIVAFLILVFELGVITAIAINPELVWNKIKSAETKIINIGETATVYNIPELDYLYGDASDMEVTYYMPYLDIWSKYNTGYGILKEQQEIDDTKDYRELVDISMPTIGDSDIGHWSVLLMDAFSYWGHSNSLDHSILVDGHTYNGKEINNNAYRVVDHFMAPRVELDDDYDTISMEITPNENYNGEFQSGFVDLLCKLINCILCCLLSLIKMLTFIWQWFVIYVFIFRVLIGKGAEGKSGTDIFIETFSPTLALVFLGMYTGIVMIIGMNAEGLLGIILELGLIWLTVKLLKWWKERNEKFFPRTLVWLYWLTNMSSASRKLHEQDLRNRAKNEAIEAGMGADFINKSLEEQRDELFDASGNVKSQYRDHKYDTVVNGWYERARRQEGVGHNKVHDEQTRNIMRSMEQSERYKDSTQKINNKLNGVKSKEDKQRIKEESMSRPLTKEEYKQSSYGKIGTKLNAKRMESQLGRMKKKEDKINQQNEAESEALERAKLEESIRKAKEEAEAKKKNN